MYPIRLPQGDLKFTIWKPLIALILTVLKIIKKDLFLVVKGIKNYDFNIENISVYLWLFSTFSTFKEKTQYLKGLQDPARKVPGTCAHMKFVQIEFRADNILKSESSTNFVVSLSKIFSSRQ